MQLSDLDLNKTYSYADYLKWRFDERLELIKGKIFKMSPAPSRSHQEIVGFVFNKLYMFLSKRPCKVYISPFDVRLPNRSIEDKSIYTVVQPDICVICDLAKLDDKGCVGAPDIVIEILSPGNSKKELSNKYDVYQEAGVKEYWLIHPGEKTIFKYVLNQNGLFYAAKPLLAGDILNSDILPGFELDLTGVFIES